MSKYNVANNTTGVYKITCNVNGKSYVGASVNIASRFSNHMNRDARKYSDRDFYKDVLNYGYKNFTFEVLEVCHKDDLLTKEQYHYDIINPEYNDIRPCEVNFSNELVRRKGLEKSQSPENIAIRKALYNSPKYKKMFREVNISKMRPVIMNTLDGEFIAEFMSLQECSRWLHENTSFKGKNKTSKVKAVADGERPTAYGYKFHYPIKSLETIPKGSTHTISTYVEAVNKMI